MVLLFMPDGDAFVVLASNYGSERPPAWWNNLEARPAATVHVGGRTVAVRARALAGAERESLLPRVRAWNGLWRGYLATLRRELPVVRLEPLTTAPTRPG